MLTFAKTFILLAMAIASWACEECQSIAAGSLKAVRSSAQTTTEQRWSDPVTWGGVLPVAGQDVTIPSGMTVILDSDTPVLGGLLVKGRLMFDDSADRHLQAHWIAVMVEGALFQIGTQAQPFSHRAQVTLHGTDKTINVMGVAPLSMGTKFLIAQNGGTIEIHSESRNKASWTQLQTSAAVGSTSIQVAASGGWQIGDKLVIAPSGFRALQAEEVTITAISGTTLGIAPALRYEHLGQILTVAGRSVDLRAEVGLLNRNIIIQGAPDSDAIAFGAHCEVMPGGVAHVEGVEFVRCGQAGLKGRYPFHWHMVDRLPQLGVSGAGQWIRRCSVHDSFQRAFALHGTNDVVIEENFAYDIPNHAFVISEDGDERRNRVLSNLAIGVRTPPFSAFAFPQNNSAHPSAQNENVSSGFWMRSPNNDVIGNHVAGVIGGGNGFFIDGNDTPVDRINVSISEPVNFSGNVAHAIGTLGTSGFVGVGYPVPSQRGFVLSGIRSGGARMLMRDCLAYKCEQAGYWFETNDEAMDSCISSDCGQGAGGDAMSATVTNSLFIGRSVNTIEEAEAAVSHNGTPRPAFGIIIERAADRLRVGNNTFVECSSGAFGTVDNDLLVSAGCVFEDNVFIGDNEPRFHNDSTPGWGLPILDLHGQLSGTGVPSLISGARLSAASVEPAGWNGAWSTPVTAVPTYQNVRISAPADGITVSNPVTVQFEVIGADFSAGDRIFLSVDGAALNAAGSNSLELSSAAPVTLLALPSGPRRINAQLITSRTGISATRPSSQVMISVDAPAPLREPDAPTTVVPGLDYAVYTGSFDAIVPNFSTLSSVSSGVISEPTTSSLIALSPRSEDYAIRFSGFIDAPHDGTYTFTSADQQGTPAVDDQVRLSIGTTTVLVQNWAPPVNVGTIRLRRGKHAVTIGYCQGRFEQTLLLNWSTPGFSSRPIPSTAWFRAASGNPPGPVVGSGWQGGDLGSVSLAGSVSGTPPAPLTVYGSGKGTRRRADSGFFVSHTLAANGTITARVDTLVGATPWDVAGLMLRDGTAADARQVTVAVTGGNGVLVSHRPTSGAPTAVTMGSTTNTPHWLRLKRNGSEIIASESADGVVWSVVTTVDLGSSAALSLGFFVASGADETMATGQFSQITIFEPPAGAG